MTCYNYLRGCSITDAFSLLFSRGARTEKKKETYFNHRFNVYLLTIVQYGEGFAQAVGQPNEHCDVLCNGKRLIKAENNVSAEALSSLLFFYLPKLL